MAVRPGQIRYLTKGKLLGAKSHRGFVDTFNWMLSWIYNFRTGPGLKITGERAGKPRLSLTLLNGDGAPIDDGGGDTPYEITGEGGGDAPFTVRLHKTEGAPDGQWEIYLPADILYVDRAVVDATDGLSAADGAPPDWYELPAFPDEGTSGPVYLHVTLPYDEEQSDSESGSGSDSESGSGSSVHHDAEAEILTTRETPGEHDFYVTVARIESSGNVKQLVVGSIVLGSGAGGSSSDRSSFAYVGGIICVGAVVIGRQAYKVNEDGFDINEDGEGDGDYRVRVELDVYGGDPTITVEYGDGFEAPPSELVSFFPLYTIEDGAVAADYRGTFVLPVWENLQEQQT